MPLYFVALIPPEPLQSEIQQHRLYFKKKFNSKHALKSPPHITILSPFHCRLEEELIEHLATHFKTVPAMEISLKDFSHFEKRVIFIAVAHHKSLLKTQQELEAFARNHGDLFNYNYHPRPYHPHLTIAFKDLTEENYHQAWKSYQHKHFSASFMADEVYLFKHDRKRWQVIRSFKL